MKELSIEEKAKAYEEKLDVARHIYADPGVKEEDKYYIEVIFPELAESDDEKIRKEIIATIHLYYGEPLENEAKEMIAWLENQGEQKSTDKIEPKFKVGQTIKKEGFNLGFTIAKIEDGFYYNDDGDYFPFTGQDNWELVEQNPAWSEEDETTKNNISHIIRQYDKISKRENQPCWYVGDCLLWMQNIKDRVQPQPVQEWSEEDQKIASRIASVLEEAASEHAFMSTKRLIGDKEVIEIEGWLKSLRPQNRWKPSDEQMEALDDFIYAKYPNVEKHGAAVKSLYQDLKKLREE